MRRRTFLMAGACTLPLAMAGCRPLRSEDAVQPPAPVGEPDPDGDIRAAFYFAYPMYEIARTAQNRTQALGDNPGRLNMLGHRARLLDHTSRAVTAPNNDTIYSSAFLELWAGPLELVVPTEKERYFSIAFMNAMTDNFAYIGTRATEGEGGSFWIVGPQWTGDVPEGMKLIRCDTNDVWMLGRTLVDGPEDLPEAQAFQSRIRLVIPDGRPPARPYQVDASGELDAEKFLSVINEMLARSPGATGALSRAPDYAALGVGAPENLSPELLARWDAFLPTGLRALRDTFTYRDLVIDGWAYQEKGVGDFGTKDKLRAAVALGGLAALGEEEAMYFHANLDPDGNQLSGANKYRWRVPAGGVPAEAFWSLTMYEAFPDGRYFLVENPINRYSIGDRTKGLVVEPDGSFEILIQHEPPPDDMMANWLPAPAGNMRLALRAYIPGQVLLDRKWKVPPLVRIAAE